MAAAPFPANSPGLYNPANSQFQLHASNATAGSDTKFAFGAAKTNYIPVAGDFNGDKLDTVGLYDPATSQFQLRNANSSTGELNSFDFGQPGTNYQPIVGDWNGDGIDTVGLYQADVGQFLLRQTNSSGSADIIVDLGPAGSNWKPLAGDWDGDGTDTLGLYDPARKEFHLYNANAAGASEKVFAFGNAGVQPLAGDFNGDGKDTIGVYDRAKNTFSLRNTNATGRAEVTFKLGKASAGWSAVVGNWTFSAALPVNGVYTVPGAADQHVTATLVARNANYKSEVGIFPVDDANGRIGTLKPGDKGYAAAALSSPGRVVIFNPSDGPGKSAAVQFMGGTKFAMYLIDNDTTENFLRLNPQDSIGKKPLAYFTIKKANPDKFDHVRYTLPNQFGWEDQKNGGDKDFNDVMGRIDFSFMPTTPVDKVQPVVVINTPTPDQLSNQAVTVRGKATDDSSGVDRVQASLDGGGLFDVTFGADGSFQFPVPLALDGSVDGRHTFFVRATDKAGNVSLDAPGSIILDTIAPPVTLDLAPAFDDAPLGDQHTGQSPVNLTGQTEPSRTVELLQGGQVIQTTTSSNSGSFTFTAVALALGGNAFVARAADAAGNVGQVANSFTRDGICTFDASLTGWTAAQTGGSGQGSVTTDSCVATLREGNSFNVTLSRTFLVTATTPQISFTYANLNFDTTDSQLINDAFEVALLDSDGHALVPTFTIGRDAFFNATEGLTAALGSKTSQSGNKITLNLADVPTGTQATLLLRLVNNDGDHGTSVQIVSADVPVAAANSPTGTPSTPSLSAALLAAGSNDLRTFTPSSIDPTVIETVTEATASSTMDSPGSAGDDSPIIVKVGYADNLRASPFFPEPWNGSPNTVYVGSGGAIDAGAILIINNGTVPVTVNDVRVTVPTGAVLSLWGSNVIPAGGNLILTQTTQYDFDTSEYVTLGFPQTYPDGEAEHASHIDITVDGSPLPTFLDTGHVLTTGGSDLAAGGANESQNWRMIGTSGISNPGGATIFLTASAPGPQFSSGTSVILSGRATTSGLQPNGTPDTVSMVLVNGQPVDALDASGAFFAKVILSPGENTYTITAFDAANQTATATLVVLGLKQNPDAIDFSQFIDTSASFAVDYARTSFDDANRILYADSAVHNLGQYPANVPLLVGVKNISDPSVIPLNNAGTLPDGTPYYDFTGLVTGGSLNPDGRTGTLTLPFFDPNRVQFKYDLIFLGQPNHAPAFTTVPVIEATIGRPYTYPAAATDSDSDPLTFSLVSGPTGLAIDGHTGLVTWTPTATELGTHDVTLHVADGRGGSADQHFVLNAIPAPPNRPPIITSTPVVVANATPEDGGFVFLTGHDAIWHAAIGANNAVGAKHFAKAAIDYARHGSTLPFLFVESINVPLTANNIHEAGVLSSVLGYSTSDFVVADASALAGLTDFRKELNKYSAIVVASDHGGMLTSSELAFLDDHSDDLISYVNAGGGIAAFSEGNEVGLIGDTPRFKFLPFITSSADFTAFESSNSVTSFGASLGITTGDVNGNFSHNYFTATGGMVPVDLLNGNPNYPLSLAFHGSIAVGGLENAYVYDVQAFDPDNDSLTYSLIDRPDGMFIDPVSGLITFAPTAAQIGNQHVTVQASDGRGGIATQHYTLCVLADPNNHAPVIVSDSQSYTAPSPRSAFQIFDTGVGDDGQLLPLGSMDPHWSVIAGPGITSPQPSFVKTSQEPYAISPSALWIWVTPYEASSPYTFRTTFDLTGFDPETAEIRGSWGVDNYAKIVLNGHTDGIGSGTLDFGSVTSTDTFLRFHDFVVNSGFQPGLNTLDVVAVDTGFLAGLNLNSFVASAVPLKDGHFTFEHTIRAVDADGDTLLFTAENLPYGMILDAQSGVLRWNPAEDQVGVHVIQIRVTDSRGGFDEQNFTINVSQSSGKIRGTKFNDVNANGSRDSGLFGINLIANGDAEGGPGVSSYGNVSRPLPGWTTTNGFTAVQYAAAENRVYPFSTDPGPSNRGTNFFSGGPEDTTASASQVIDVTPASGAIDRGEVTFDLSGYLGGWKQEGDNVVLSVTFRGASGNVLGTSSIGPVTPADRNSLTGLFFRTASGSIPAATRRIDVLLTSTRSDGTSCDGYADNLSLVLTSNDSTETRSNLIVNGSFEDGLLGVNSDYLHTPQGNTTEGTWWVAPHDPGGSWGPPRSSTNVGRLNANGDNTAASGGKRVWWQTVHLEAGRSYDFSAWAWATHAGADGYQLRFAFNNVQIGQVLAASQAGLWEPFNATYQAATTGPLEISIFDVSGRTFPNDFMLDDISLTDVSPAEPGLANWTIYLDQNQNGHRDPGERFTTTAQAGNDQVIGGQARLLVASYEADSISRFDPESGVFAGQLASSGSGGLNGPESMVIGPDGNIYATSALTGNVLRYDGETGALIDTFARTGVAPPSNVINESINRDLVFGPDGNLYVTDRAGNRILRFDGVTGEFINVFVSAGSGGLNQPEGLTFGRDGNLYVTTDPDGANGDGVLRFDGKTGAFLGGFAALNFPDHGPGHLTFGPDGDLFVAVFWQGGTVVGAVQRFDGTTGASKGLFVPQGDHGLFGPTDLGFGPDGNLYVSDYVNDRVLRYNGVTGQFIDVFISSGSGGLDGPTSILFLPPSQKGSYAFTDLAPGTYYVREELQPGWRQTAPTTDVHVVTLGANQIVSGRDFGNQQTGDTSSRDPILTAPINDQKQATAGDLYRLNFVATDPDGDSLTFDLPAAPAGMTIHPELGVLVWQPTLDQIGTHTVVVRVRDDNGGLALQSFIVTVAPPNTPPVFTSSPVLQAVVGLPYQYRVAIQDADGDDVALSLVTPLAGMVFDAATATLTWNPTGLQLGPQAVELLANDRHGGVISQSFIVNVVAAAPNTAPVIGSTPRKETPFGVAYIYPVIATDANRDPLVYSLENPPVGMTIDVQGIIRWQPTAANAGPNHVRIRVIDGRGGEAVQEFDLQVVATAANAAPLIVSNPVPVAIHDEPYRYDAKALDADNDTVVWSLDQAPLGMSINPITGTIRWIPLEDQLGLTTVILRVQDALLASSTQQFTIDVRCENLPPAIISVPPTQVTVTQAFADSSINVPGTTSSLIKVNAGSYPGGVLLDISATGSVDLVGGSAPLTWATNPDGSLTTAVTAPEYLYANFGATNYPTDFGGDGINHFAGGGANYDPQSVPAFGFAGALTTDTNSAQAIRLGSLVGTFSANPSRDDWFLIGSHKSIVVPPGGGTLYIAVNETFSSNDTGSFSVHIHPAAPASSSYIYPVRAADPEQQPVTFSLDTAPAGMTIDPQTGIIRWNPTTGQVGLQNVLVRATDGDGASGTQAYTIKVSLSTDPAVPGDPTSPPLGNHAPVITSTPVFNAQLNLVYQYQLAAIDPDGDPLVFNLSQKPDGMAIDPQSGLIVWTPTAAQAGTHQVTVVVRDTNNAVATQSFIVVAKANQPPTVISTAPTAAVSPTATYRYDVRATDPDNDPLTYALTAAPAGMTIDNLGRIRWSVPANQNTSQPVSATVAVSDPFGHTVTQSFNITVAPDTAAPTVRLTTSAALVDAESRFVVDKNGQVRFQVLASDNVGVAKITLTLGDVSIPLDASGVGFATPQTPGIVHAVATAFDAAGKSSTAELDLRVRDPNDADAPVVNITSPDQARIDNVVTYLTNVIGSVSDSNLLLWHLDYALASAVDINDLPAPDPDWHEISRGTTNVTSGLLGVFDPTMLQNDGYVLRLYAEDTGGNINTRGVLVGVQGSAKLGNFHLEFTDLTVPLAGFPITITRTYDTLQANEEGDFGFGWKLSLADADIRETVPEGFSFQIGTRVYLNDPSGKRIGFTFDPIQTGTFLGTLWTPRFTADPGVYSTLSVDDTQVGAPGTIFAALSGPYNPSRYHLTTADGTRYDYDQTAGLQKVTDLNNNTLTYTTDAIVHSSGEHIDLHRDGRGRITEIVDTQGHSLKYAYNAAGDLVSFTDQVNLTMTFSYVSGHPHFLDEIHDPLGRRASKTIYGPDGRIQKVIDALGNETLQNFDPTHFTGTTTDAKGNVTLLEYDTRGNVVAATDASGNTTRLTYDSDDNLIEQKDGRGFTTSQTFDSRGNRTSVTDPAGGVHRFEYNSFNKVTREVDPRGNVITSRYDDRGNLVEYVNAVGSSSSITYDAAGRPLSFTDNTGQTRLFRYAAASRPAETINPDGTARKFEYNSLGLATKITDELGNVSSLEFDRRGRLVAITDSLGGVTRFTFNGNLLVSEQDAGGHVTTYEYDAANRKIKDIDAAGGITKTEYDANGQIIAVTDPLGHVTRSEYDGTGRLIATIDAAGAVTRYEYDSVGNQTAIVDALGRRQQFTYDALGRVLTKDDCPCPDIHYSYDLNGNLTATTDKRGNITRYTYDGLNRLVSTIDALGGITSRTYDVNGNLASLTDANGHTTTFVYDNRNHLIRQTDPTGATIRFGYDAAGNQTSMTDALGNVTRNQYDSLGRSIATVSPLGGSGVSTYDHLGNLLSSTDALGRATTYQYDALNRLTFETNAEGGVTRYQYDLAGNRIAVIDPDNNRTAFAFDTVNRLVKETDPLGNFSTFSYDAMGNQIEAVDRDGRRRTFDYDNLNRITEERWWSGASEIRTIQFGYDSSDNLVSASDSDSDYSQTFDALNRVTTIDNAGTASVPHVVLTYAYDPVGNITRITDSLSATVALAYNSRNEVTRESLDAGMGHSAAVTSSYDARGGRQQVTRLTSGTGGAIVGRTTFGYDADGRVIDIVHRNAADAVLVDYDYFYDLAHELVRESHHGETTNYGYDRTKQLVSADNSTLADESFSFDKAGNRTTDTTIGLGNHLLSDATFTYRYDKEGNLVEKTDKISHERTQFTYDYRNRLTTVDRTSALGGTLSHVEFTYDVFDRRIATTTDGALLATVYDRSNPWADFDQSGLNRRYLYGPGEDFLIASQDALGINRWYLTDRLSTVRDVAEASGSIIDHIDYSAFGQILSESTPAAADRFRFTSREWIAAISLYDYRARFYDPFGGRFIQEDPIRFDSSDANFYRAFGNSPTLFVDPRGTEAEEAVLVGGIATVGVLSQVTAAEVTTSIVIGVEAEIIVGVEAATAAVSALRTLVVIEATTKGWIFYATRGVLGAFGLLIGTFAGDNAQNHDVTGELKTVFQADVGENLSVRKRVRDKTCDPNNPIPLYPKVQKINEHVHGTPNYVNRVKQGKPTSYFDSYADAISFAMVAWQSGSQNPRYGGVAKTSPRLPSPVGTGGFGGYQYQATIIVDKSCFFHAFPDGPEYKK